MGNNEKKEYGGCLSILLPLWIIGQILTIIYNLAFAGFYTDFPMMPIILIGINIIALAGIILLLQFKKIGFYIFILTFIITFFVGVLFPDYVRNHTIFRSIFGLGLFLLLMSFKSKETKLNGYQTLGIFNFHKNKEGDASPQIQDDKSDEIKNESVEKEVVEMVNPEKGAPLISEYINEENNNKEKIEVDACSIDVEEINHKEKKGKEKEQSFYSFCKRIKKSNKGIRIGIYSFLGVLLLFLAISLFVHFKSYPSYISSFCDKWKYTFNMSNNSLGRTLLDKVYSQRKNTWYLLDIPGYEKIVSDSARFYKNRDDIYREHPNASSYMAESIINDFSTVESNVYYIIDSGSGEPSAYNGSKLLSDNDVIADAFTKKVYRAIKYDYDKQRKKEIQLLDEAAQIPVSDIELIRELGLAYEKLGVFSKAADYYRFEMDHNGNNSEIRGMFAYALALNGEFSNSRKQAEIALEDNSKERYALSSLAIVEADEFNWKEVKTYAKKAIDYGVENSYVYYAYCEALFKQGEIKASHMYYNKAYELYRLNPRRDKYSQYAGCPFEVISIHYCSERHDGKIIIPYDGTLVSGLCYFIGIKIDANVLRSDEAKIGIKLYSNGRLETGQTSRDGYTYYEEVSIRDLGQTTIYLSGWGNDKPGAWSAGSHQIEIWYKNEKIAEDSFYIY